MSESSQPRDPGSDTTATTPGDSPLSPIEPQEIPIDSIVDEVVDAAITRMTVRSGEAEFLDKITPEHITDMIRGSGDAGERESVTERWRIVGGIVTLAIVLIAICVLSSMLIAGGKPEYVLQLLGYFAAYIGGVGTPAAIKMAKRSMQSPPHQPHQK